MQECLLTPNLVQYHAIPQQCKATDPQIKECGVAIGMGEPTTKRGTAVVPRTWIKTYLQTEEIGLTKLSMKREVLGWLIAARSGHGHFGGLASKIFP